AAQVAAVIGLLFEQPEGGPVVIVDPVNAAAFQVLAQRFNGAQELTLLHGEGAHGKIDWRALREQEQRFEQGQRILASREGHRDPVPVPDHAEPMNRLTDFPQKSLFYFHYIDYTGRDPYNPKRRTPPQCGGLMNWSASTGPCSRSAPVKP